MKKKALITGITGQIGSYLAELLVEKNYEVYGVIRKKLDRKEAIVEHSGRYIILEGDLDDPNSMESIIKRVNPDEIYNLAAQSDAQISFHVPEYTLKTNGAILVRLCEAVRKLNKPVKIFQASSAQLYGDVYDGLVDELTPFHPKNPYAIAKLCAHWTVKYYRERYNLFACNGILFNSESPRRGENFVTRKITKSIAEISKGRLEPLAIGDLEAKRDWHHAKDTAFAMWKMLQSEKPSDYIIASGEAHSVREFIESAFRHIGIELSWKGQGIDEVGYDKKTGRTYVVVDPIHFRPHEKNHSMHGNISKIKNELGWHPTYKFDDLVKEMVIHDVKNSGI